MKYNTEMTNTAGVTSYKEKLGLVSDFIKHNFRHYNSATLIDAAEAFREHIASGKKMLLAMGGALSTAEIGITLAEMIRQGKFHAVSCSANNGEEDIFNLVANQLYKRIPNYRDLTPQDEKDLLDNHFNRVTDTCIPEEEAFRRIQKHIFKLWKDADDKGESYLPHEYLYKLILSGDLEEHYADNGGQGGYLKNSWLYAAARANIPLLMGGWADSTLGNIFTSYCIKGELKSTTVKSDVEQMIAFADWYCHQTMGVGVHELLNKSDPEKTSQSINSIGFFQLGGGIAGDFPACTQPMLTSDIGVNTPAWSYFCQVTDTNESYGSYSGCSPNEKITWGKLDIETLKYSINSDATIVAPLIFAYVLGK